MKLEGQKVLDKMQQYLQEGEHKAPKNATPAQLHTALSEAIMTEIADKWRASQQKHQGARHAAYLSAEFLVGRAIYNNLLCLGLTQQVDQWLKEQGTSLAALEEIEDAALGNGGLGRLAACYLDSAATVNVPLDGYGIRYRYGLFAQGIKDGFQTEAPDDWTKQGDPWSVRKQEERVKITFGDQTVWAVPYDMPILGYATDNIGTLRLWQAEPYGDAPTDEERKRAEEISGVLYPDDSTAEGKLLRLKQQYFFSSASLQDMLRIYKAKHGKDFSKFADLHAIQLNDTHPVISIPELIRLLAQEGVPFAESFPIACKVFSYTNHTIMQEALEQWPRMFIKQAAPGIFPIIAQIDEELTAELKAKNVPAETAAKMAIIQNDNVQMALLAVYAGRFVNGVARLHTEIIKNELFHEWYKIWPERFQNKTNGVTQRRWLALCNPELAAMLTRLLGSEAWMTDLSALKTLEKYQDDPAVLQELMDIKAKQHQILADYLKQRNGITLEPNTIYDVQIKRLHEYKRQFLNILAVLELYFEIKEGTLREFTPTTFLFGAKSAPGYYRAKGIIKLINTVAELIAADPAVSPYIKVVFVPNYNVSSAERLIAAADVSEQISTAGTEASGTGNMKLMMNGAVTLGTLDGANVEIVEEAGERANYIFGAHVEEIHDRAKDYNPVQLYESDNRIHRALDALVDGTLDDGGTGMFRELYDSILKGASWHKPDQYYLLLDFGRYLDAKILVNRDYKDKLAFAKKRWLNICNSGKFSSDRSIREYAKDLWFI